LFFENKENNIQRMKTLKVLGIIGIVVVVLALCTQIGWTDDTASGAIGWGVISEAFLLAYSIVGIVQANKAHKKIK